MEFIGRAKLYERVCISLFLCVIVVVVLFILLIFIYFISFLLLLSLFLFASLHWHADFFQYYLKYFAKKAFFVTEKKIRE